MRGPIVPLPLPPRYPWKVMVEAAYRKYPNPHSSHVHSLDTLQRRLAGRTLYSHRLFCATWSIPNLVLKVHHSMPHPHSQYALAK